MAHRSRIAAVASLAAIACAMTTLAAAQERPYGAADGRVSIAAEVSMTSSETDNEAYFNFTDYDHDALRTIRARVLAQWQPARRFGVLGELRVENTDTIEAAALYIRWRPFADRELDVQVGRIPPVIGAFARHAYGRDNLLIGTPLVY